MRPTPRWRRSFSATSSGMANQSRRDHWGIRWTIRRAGKRTPHQGRIMNLEVEAKGRMTLGVEAVQTKIQSSGQMVVKFSAFLNFLLAVQGQMEVRFRAMGPEIQAIESDTLGVRKS